MANRRYQKGLRNEYKARNRLRGEGWYVFRAAGSKGMWDLCALKSLPNPPFLVVRIIQLKTNGRPPRKEMEAMKKFKMNNAIKELWIYRDRIAEPEVIRL